MNTFPWPIFITLLATGILCTLAVIPYSLALNPGALDALKEKQAKSTKPAIPPALIILFAGAVQGGLLVAIALYLGLLVSRAVGLGMPVLDAVYSGQPTAESLLAMLPASLLVGFVGGALLMAVEQIVFRPRLPVQLRQADKRIPFWKRLLACFYGGFVEEILMRLFVFAGFAWLIGLVWKSPAGLPSVGAFWIANILANVLFGLGHLPTTARLTPLTPLVVARAVILNSMIGLGCGFLFMAYGLEAAIIAHFSADIVIHLIAPAVVKNEASS
jgi:hypothetical protein